MVESNSWLWWGVAKLQHEHFVQCRPIFFSSYYEYQDKNEYYDDQDFLFISTFLAFILLKVLKIPYPYLQEKKCSLILRIILSVCLENQHKNFKEEKKYYIFFSIFLFWFSKNLKIRIKFFRSFSIKFLYYFCNFIVRNNYPHF